MAASVGGVSTSIARGEPSALVGRVTTWVVPGLNGVGAHAIGDNAGEWRYRLIHHESAAAIETWLRAIDALVGTVISVTDNFGTVRSNLLVMRSSGHRKHAVVASTGNCRGEVTISGVVSA